ncbi:toll/interleukin-1 receptor domain-containing protein [Algoriphagus sp. H41]|uniref:Toll/interleukin-1 receptor domain-containing protein n=1 Tax=Algoriphagus oliviformis TaxID=2811231 RepID=A0ABS3C2Y9_9BACT|nr:toll/interleukin-1 receptor domain-containing protein [Algoriphagus oliviformis]MBN7810974.1 toll/interleukin-1 receptor domain-containing protein [Algoriphagus oliviformis]
MAQQEVFISYAWGGESEKVAEELEKILNANSFNLVRDKTHLEFKGLIREFMQRIGQGHLVVLVISDKYLKSKNCMFELLEVAKRGEFHDRVFPIVLPDAKIYDAFSLIDYVGYWDQEIRALNAKIKGIDSLADTRKILEELDLYADIRGAIDDLAGKIGNMNTLSLETMRERNYLPLLDALRGSASPTPTPDGPSRKEGKVLYHIPGMMQLDRWTRCTVRLAWEEIYLREGITIPKDELQIESIRLAEVMQVALTEGRDGHHFEIKALNNEEQFIFGDDFTEWLFDVKPLALGSFTLILRITLIHIIQGKERKKDIVLEREVITETVAPLPLPRFETAERGLSKSQDAEIDNIHPELSEGLASGSVPKKETLAAPAPAPTAGGTKTKSYPRDRPPIGTPSKKDPDAWASSPRKTGNILIRLLPYAASLAGIVFIAYLILPRAESEYAGTPDEFTTDSLGVGFPFPEEKMLVAFSLNATDPSGVAVSETYLFSVREIDLDSLDQLQVEGYEIKLIPASDSISSQAVMVGDLSFEAIQDTMESIAKKSAQARGQMINRKNLRLQPQN